MHMVKIQLRHAHKANKGKRLKLARTMRYGYFQGKCGEIMFVVPLSGPTYYALQIFFIVNKEINSDNKIGVQLNIFGSK